MTVKTIKRRKSWPKWARWYTLQNGSMHDFVHPLGRVYEDRPKYLGTQCAWVPFGRYAKCAVAIGTNKSPAESLRRIVP